MLIAAKLRHHDALESPALTGTVANLRSLVMLVWVTVIEILIVWQDSPVVTIIA